MAKIGLSKPYFAKYANTGETVTYSDCALMGKAVELSIELDGADDNVLYADNGPAESDNQFAGGTAKLTTDDLLPDVLMSVLGIAKEQMTVDGVTTEGAAWYKFNDEQVTPYGGFGAVVMVKNNGAIGYQAVVLPKLQFTNPADNFKTKGETVEWGTPEIEATILRDDTAKHEWKRISTVLATEAEAEAAIKAFFGAAA